MGIPRAFRKNLMYSMVAARGGPMRARIINLILGGPLNANQITGALGVDYKTVKHHLEVLLKNHWATSSQDKYGAKFSSTFTGEEKEVFDEIWSQIGKKL